MIHAGTVTVDMVRDHIDTSKYVDGKLKFLDRYMFKIHEEKLSSSAHNFCNSIFGVSSCTQSGSSVESFNEDSKQETTKGPMSDSNEGNSESGSSITHFEETFVNEDMDEAQEIYTIDDDSNDVVFVEPAILPDIQTSSKEEFVDLEMNQTINETYQIHDDFVTQDMLPTIQTEQADPLASDSNVVTNVTDESILKGILLSTKNDGTKYRKPKSEYSKDLALFFVKYLASNRKKHININLKEYMHDLAEVVCKRSAPEKRKYFLSRVDLIVSKILEEKEG